MATSTKWGRKFLDEHFTPLLDACSHVAIDEYKNSLASWRLDKQQRAAEHDTSRFVRLEEIVDGRLEIILSRYDRRISFNIARSLLPFEVHYLAGIVDPSAAFFSTVLA